MRLKVFVSLLLYLLLFTALHWPTNCWSSAPPWVDSSLTPLFLFQLRVRPIRSTASVIEIAAQHPNGQLQKSLSSLDSSLNVAEHHSWPFTNCRGQKQQYFGNLEQKQTASTQLLTGIDLTVLSKQCEHGCVDRRHAKLQWGWGAHQKSKSLQVNSSKLRGMSPWEHCNASQTPRQNIW